MTVCKTDKNVGIKRGGFFAARAVKVFRLKNRERVFPCENSYRRRNRRFVPSLRRRRICKDSCDFKAAGRTFFKKNTQSFRRSIGASGIQYANHFSPPEDLVFFAAAAAFFAAILRSFASRSRRFCSARSARFLN